MDALELKDYQGSRYTAVNIVDMSTSFQQIVLVKPGGWEPQRATVCEKFSWPLDKLGGSS